MAVINGTQLDDILTGTDQQDLIFGKGGIPNAAPPLGLKLTG